MKTLFTQIALLTISNFIFAQTNLSCITYGTPSGASQLNQVGYFFNGAPVEYNGCQSTPSIIIAVIDSACNPWTNCNHNFGQWNQFTPSPLSSCSDPGTGTCRNRAEKYFIFQLDHSVQIDSMTSMLNSIPQDHYVLAYTWFTEIYSSIPGFKTAFQNLGATQITTLPDTFPYIFFMRIGQPGSILELTGSHSSDTLILNTQLNCLTSSVPDIDFINSIKIYPNPASEFLNLSNVPPGMKWGIHELTGKLVKSELLEDDKINVGNLPKATYLLTLQQDDKIFRKLFVVN